MNNLTIFSVAMHTLKSSPCLFSRAPIVLKRSPLFFGRRFTSFGRLDAFIKSSHGRSWRLSQIGLKESAYKGNICLRNLTSILERGWKEVRIFLKKMEWSSWIFQTKWTCTKSLQSKSLCLISLGVIAAKGFYTKAFCDKIKLSHKSRVSGLSEKEKRCYSEDQTFNWKLFISFLLPDIWLFLFASISAFAVALVNIQLPMLLGELVNAISALTRDSETQIDVFQHLYQPSIKLILNYASQAGLTFLYITLLSSFGERFAARLRIALFDSLIQQDISFFDAYKTGELVNRLTADIQDFKSSFKQCISQGLKSMTQVVGCFLTLYAVSPKLTGFMLILLPSIIVTGVALGTFLRRLSRNSQEQIAKATSVADEAIGNIRTVRAFAMESKESGFYMHEVFKAKVGSEVLGVGIAIFQSLANLAINGIALTTMYAGGVLLNANEITTGDLMGFLVATQTIQRSLGVISVLFGQIVRGLSAGSRVFEFMETKPTIPVEGGAKVEPSELRGEISLQNVHFSYPQRPGQKILDDLSLIVPAAKMVALCAPSGSGKSTIASLVERFYDVDDGSIMIDGHDIRSLDAKWLRGELIGFINQEPILFATTVMENIRYGKQDASDEEVFEAARHANADAFIREFPEGYNTVVGERGVTVSGGQKQRIAIARALLKNPKILILDEATSALDAESEGIVQEALDKAAKGRTVLVIAHRLSTIRHADTIVVLFKGKVQESGTHEELIKKKGMYFDLVQRQTIGEKNEEKH